MYFSHSPGAVDCDEVGAWPFLEFGHSLVSWRTRDSEKSIQGDESKDFLARNFNYHGG